MTSTTPTAPETTTAAAPGAADQDDVLVADDLVEEVSIDGMCGVY